MRLFLCGKHKQYHGRKQLDQSALTDYNKGKSPKGRLNFMKENRKLLKEVLKDIQHDMSDEEVLNLLADSKISESPATEKYTLGQRAADAIAKFAGSWAFIFAFTGVLILWMVVNTILASNAFDPYPFILLNLVLSCVAAIQAPLIMMSQNGRRKRIAAARRMITRSISRPRL